MRHLLQPDCFEFVLVEEIDLGFTVLHLIRFNLHLAETVECEELGFFGGVWALDGECAFDYLEFEVGWEEDLDLVGEGMARIEFYVALYTEML